MPEVRVNARRKLLVAASAVLLTTPLASLGQQQSKVARIDYLAASSIANNARYAQAFREALHELGYVEGKNLVIEYRWAEGNFERLPDLAAELVRLRVDVILAVGDPVTKGRTKEQAERDPVETRRLIARELVDSPPPNSEDRKPPPGP